MYSTDLSAYQLSWEGDPKGGLTEHSTVRVHTQMPAVR